MLIVHEVMGRNCGWLTGGDRAVLPPMLDSKEWLPEFGVPRARRDVHAVFVPEMELDLAAEAERLKAVMDEVGNVNIFLSEGAGVDSIVGADGGRRRGGPP